MELKPTFSISEHYFKGYFNYKIPHRSQSKRADKSMYVVSLLVHIYG